MTNKGRPGKYINILASYFAMKVYKKNENIPATYRNLKRLNSLYHKKISYHLELYNLALQQKLWEEALNHINNAFENSKKPYDPKLYEYKANVLVKLKKHLDAIKFYEKYLETNSHNMDNIFKIGELHFKLKNWNSAIKYFEPLMQKNKINLNGKYLLAESYFNIKKYDEAEHCYNSILKEKDKKIDQQKLAIVYYKLGLLTSNKNENHELNDYYKKAIKFDRKLKSKSLGIGAFHEHYLHPELALKAYKEKFHLNESNVNVCAKIATLLKNSQNYSEAINYYNKLLALDITEAEWHLDLAYCYEQIGEDNSAITWYKSGIDRDLEHNSNSYRRLGFLLYNNGQHHEALETFREAVIFEKPFSVKQGIYDKNIIKKNIRYGISYKHYTVDDNMVFYESMSGGRMMGSPFAIFEYIVNHKDFENYTHVWVVNSFRVIPKKYRVKSNIVFVTRDTDAYFKYVSKAKYLICDSTLAPYVTRKPEQLYLQTSHGIFYKTVGRDSANTPLGVAGATRNLLQATHIIVPNEYMAYKQPRSYSIKGIHSGDIAKIGYPRIDVTVNLNEELKRNIISKLGIDEKKQIVFYAPTWRGTSKAQNKFDSNQLVNDLKSLATLNVNVIFRGHPITNSLLKDIKLPKNIIVPTPDIQTNELLGMSNILISDYSSVFFDFIVTEKPIIHYLYDKEDYTKDRGLNLEDSELPGLVAKTGDQLVKLVDKCLIENKPNSQYLKAKERFSTYDKGVSSKKVVEWFFYDKKEEIDFVDKVKKGKTYLYLGGFLEDIDIQKLVDKLNSLVADNVVSLMLNKQVAKNKEKLGLLKNINPDVNLIIHDRTMPMTMDEVEAHRFYDKNHYFMNKEMEKLYNESFVRQSRRLFGDTSFDEIINCVEGSSYWEALKENKSNH